MEASEQNVPNTGKLRSTFLTAVCVLTFIGSGWGVCKAVRSYVQADNISAMASAGMEKLQDKMDENNNPSFLKSMFSSMSASLSPASIRESAVFELISCLLTLGGAIMMWNLKKAGFYLYIAGTAILIIAPMIMMGKGVLGLATGAVAAFIGVIFIVLYALNLKDMKG